jgi:hypothetical protein
VEPTVVKVEAKVIRYTREKLLSMRPSPLDAPPPHMKAIEGTVVLSLEPQDPVCYDTFDTEVIWSAVPQKSRSTVKPAPGMRGAEAPEEGRRLNRRAESGGGGGRWQRGVALPPPDKKARDKDTDNPSDLWDDPTQPTTGAAADFSAFGGALSGDAGDGGDAFDFDKMAEASKKMEQELHEPRSRASSDATGEELDTTPQHKIDPKRPLAAVGTTIRSGSGDNVNVFEDFDDPAVAAEAESEPVPIKALDEDPSASSRLMKMIGVVKDEPQSGAPVSAWGAPEAAVPLNPWGGPLPMQADPQPQQGLDLQARLREAAEVEAKVREAELRRLQQEQEEAQRRAMAQQQQQQGQAQGVQSQVELVLVERISSILENTWGRADLMSILSTLHAEDSRVIPLLNNVDALRALLLRNPRRIAIRQDPALRAEMAVLLITTTQWQQQQEQDARAQQQELQRREQERRLEEERKMALRNFQVIPDAPWFYSDPQNNIQGPFRGEEMRQWLEAGYFKGNLPISQQTSGPFHPLSSLFPDLAIAFMVKNGNVEEEARLNAEQRERERQEADARVRAEAEHQAMLEASERERQAREAADRQRLAEEKVAALKKAESGNESSAQLKMMLGLPAQDGAGQSDAPPATKSNDKKKSKNTQQRPSKEVQHTDPAKNAPPAWGGASQPITQKSMGEIQKEEARVAALNAMNNKGKTPSSGWANVAASRGGSTAWSGTAATQTPATVVAKASTTAPTGIQGRSKAKVAAAEMQTTGASQQQHGNSSVAEEFGAKMSPVLEKWCKDEMKKLNGTNDITLASFCMSLKDPEEIRQYFTTYLGSTPAVNKFAAEFIKQKGGGKSQQEEWETAATAKKGRKKKAGGR